jgi:dynactin 6
MIEIGEGAVVCETAVLDDNNGQFRICIGSGSVIHPRARIHAKCGDIVLGSRCIVEEQSSIVNRYSRIYLLTINIY